MIDVCGGIFFDCEPNILCRKFGAQQQFDDEQQRFDEGDMLARA